jgi:hypothetical protein
MQDFSVWISAEHWAPGQWQPDNDAVDVQVTLVDGTRWVATFCAYKYVDTLRTQFASDGECLGGRYLWIADLVLVEDTSRGTIEAVVQDLLRSGEFEGAFDRCPPDITERAV